MQPGNDGFRGSRVESDAFPRPPAERVVQMSHAVTSDSPVGAFSPASVNGVASASPSNAGRPAAAEPPASDGLESPPALERYDTGALETDAPPVTTTDASETSPRPEHLKLFRYNGLAMAVTGVLLLLIIIIGAGALFLNGRHVNNQTGPPADDYALGSNLPLGQAKNQLAAVGTDQLAVNGELKANNTLVVTPTARPADPQTGQIYYDRATNQPYYYDGTAFVSFASQPGVTSLGGVSGLIGVGGGLQVTNGQLTLSPSATQALTGAVVNSLQGQTGNVTLAAGNGIGITGTTISNTGLTGVSGTNGIAVSVAGGQVTIGLPQLLGAADMPSFAGLSLANPLGIASGGTGSGSFNSGGIVYYNGSALVSTPAPGSNGLCLVSSPGGPEFGSCSGGNAVTSLNNLTGALTLQAGSGITITDNGTNTITVSATDATGANVSLSNLSGVAINTDLLPGTTDTVSLGSNAARFKNLWLAGNGTVGGTLAVTGDVTGGTYNTAAISGGSLTSNTVNGLGLTSSAITGTGALSLSAGGSNQNLTLQGTGSGSVIIQAPLFHNANGATYSFDPADNSGVTATICTTAGNCVGVGGGVTTLGGTIGTIPVFTGTHAIGDSLLTQSGTTVTVDGTLAATNLQGDGSGVTNVNAATLQGNSASYFTNASNIATGTLNDNRLSSNVALLAGDNDFTGTTLQHNGSNVCDASNNCNYAPAGGGTSYIWNGITAQTADFNITGNGTVGTLSVTNNAGIGGTLTVTSTINTASITGGSLSSSAVNNLNVSGTAISGTGALSIAAGGSNQNLSLQGTGTGSVIVQTPLFHNANGATYNFDAANGSGVTATICTTVGNCAGTGGGLIASGTPTAGTIGVFTSANSIGNSQLSDSGTTLTYTGNMIIQGTNSLSLGTAGPTGNTGSVSFNNATNANKLTLQAGATATPNLTFTLPTADGGSGYCLQTNGSGVLSFNSCTGGGAGGVTSLNSLDGVLHLQGTTNQVSISSNGTDTLTLSLPQDIATTSSPIFTNVTASGTLQGATVNATSALQLNGQDINNSGVLNNVAYLGATSQTFTGANAFNGSGVGLTVANDATIGADLTVGGEIIAKAATSIQLGTAGNSTGSLLFHNAGGANTIKLQGPLTYPTGNYTLSLPSNLTGDDTICTVGTGCGTGGITGGGTGGTIPVFSGTGGSTAIGNSILTQSGTTVTAAGTLAATALQGNGSGVTNVDAVTLQGNNAAYFTNASNISSGTLNDARLSPNVALLNGTNTFTGANTFSAAGTALTVTHDASIGGTATIGTLSVTNGATVGGGVNIGSGSVYRVNGVAGATQACTGGQVLQAASVVGGIITGTPACGAAAGAGINNSTSLQTSANFNIQSGATTSVTGQLRAIASQTADLLDFENSSGTVLSGFTASGALQGGNGSGTNAAGTSMTIAGGQGTGTGSGGNINFQIAKPGTTGSALNGESTVFSLSGTNGAALLQNATDSTAAFQIQNAAGSSMLNFDTTSGTLSVLGTSLSYIGGADANGTTNGGSGNIAANDVAVSGHYEYTVNSGSTAACTATPGNATGCELKVFDITNPEAPTYIGGADSNGFTNSGNGVQDMLSIAISGHYAFIALSASNQSCFATANSTNGCELKIFDISNPATPTYVAGVDASGTVGSGTGSLTFNSISISGSNAYVASNGNGAACSQTVGQAIGCELKVFNISTPTSPSYVGGADASGSTNSGTVSTQAFESVATSGGYAYVGAAGNTGPCSATANGTNGCELKVFNISTPTAPAYAGGADASGTTNSGSASNTFNSVAVSGGYVYVATAGNSAAACAQAAGSAIGCELQDYSISNPAAPAYAGGADASGTTNSGSASGNFNEITVAGGSAYIAATGSATACSSTVGSAIGCELQQYSISTPSAPAYTAGIDSSGSTNSGTGAIQFNSVAVSGQDVYVVSNGSATTCSATAGNATGCEMKAFSNSGIQTTGLLANNLETTSLQVDGSGQIQGNLGVQGTLTVGQSLRVNGASFFQDSTNSTTAFQVQNSSGIAVLDVDTANSRMGIGNAAPNYALDVTGDINSSGVYLIGGSTVLQAVGTNNLFVGGAGSNASVTGSANTAVGTGALDVITSGYSNSAFGSNDMADISTGIYNAAFGNSALRHNTTGDYNAVLGDDAALGVIGGSDLTGSAILGYNAGTNLQTGGDYNTLLGYSAGMNLTTGAHNIIIGDSVNATSATGNYQLNIGNAIYGNLSTGHVCIDTASCTNALGVNGAIAASGSITASTTPDISETIPASDDVTPGDVVSAGPDGNVDAVRSSVPYDPTTIGVISDGTSSFRINSNGDSVNAADTGKYLVLAGRVPVHVTDENGPIEPGDYLTTSSTPGYAMKATHAGPTIGKALAAFDGTSGTVMAQTNLSYYGGPTATDYVQNGGNATLSSLTVGGMTNLADLNVSGTATINNLTVTGSATIATLTVTGSAQFAGNITVGGHIITSGTTPTVQAQAAAGTGATCTVSGNDTGGSITITTGATGFADGQECVLTFHSDFGSAPNPVIAPRNKTSAQAQAFVDADPHTMTIEFSNAPTASTMYTFNYFNTQ